MDASSLERRRSPWRPDWADGLLVLAAILMASLSRALLHHPTSPEAAGEALGHGCGAAMILGILLYGIRSLVALARGTGQRSPLMSCVLGLPVIALVVGGLLLVDAVSQAQALARIKQDLAAATAAMQAGKPLPKLDPDSADYGDARPLMRHTWEKLEACSALQREILSDQQTLGSPLETVNAADPDKVDAKLKLIETLLPKLDRMRQSLDEMNGPAAIAAVERLPIEAAMKDGFRKALQEDAPIAAKGRDLLEATKQLTAQVRAMLLIVQRDRPTNQDGLLKFNSTENLQAYQDAQPVLRSLVSRNDALLAELEAMKPRPN